MKIYIGDIRLNGAFPVFQGLLKSIFNEDCELVNAAGADIDILYREELSDEAYSIEGSRIYASGIKGATYAASTLIMNRYKYGEMTELNMTDTPYKKIRGIHMYMPARDDIPVFKRIVDVLIFLKMNTIILEVGAGMEYERRPEINTSWVEFCKKADSFPGVGKSRMLQISDIYWKDSVHTELAGGSYLTKAEVRDLVTYAKSRGINVIPEVQALSHAYYLTVPYHRIAEVQDDHFPDSYCPLNDESYDIYFDVAEEVIEVFEPNTVSVGHDEIRILGICERCRKRSGDELLAHDVNKLYDFYKSKNITMAMWAESLQRFTSYAGAEIGANIDQMTKYGVRYRKPETYKAIDKVPSDILAIDWYYSLGSKTEDCYIEHGMQPIFGNFRGSLVANWDKRSDKESLLGAEVSTWCPIKEEIFSDDGIMYDLMYSSHILWNKGCGDDSHEKINDDILAKAPLLRAIMREELAPSHRADSKLICVYKPEKEKAYAEIDLATAYIADKATRITAECIGDIIYGQNISSGIISAKPDCKAKSVVFIHSTKKSEPYYASHSYEPIDRRGIGGYTVMYDDYTTELIGTYYGREVGSLDFSLERQKNNVKKVDEIDIEIGNAKIGEAPTFTNVSEWTGGLCYYTSPIISGSASAFAYEWINPHPDKKIISIKSINTGYTDENAIVCFGIVCVE